MFAMSKFHFITKAELLCPTLRLGLFLCLDVNNIGVQPRNTIVMVVLSLCKEALTTGSGRRLFLPASQKFFTL